MSMRTIIVASLLTRTVVNLNTRPLGFDPDGLLTLRIDLPEDSYKTAEAQRIFFAQARDAVAGPLGSPQVELTSVLAGAGMGARRSFVVEGREVIEGRAQPNGLLVPANEAPSSVGVANIDYDAKGQRTLIDYKTNDATVIRTTYAYDPETFRLTHLITRRDSRACWQKPYSCGRWLPMDHWDACDEKFDKGELLKRPCYAAIDLSSTKDLTALALVFPPDQDVEDVITTLRRVLDKYSQ